MKNQKNTKAFTLTELLIASGLLTIFLLGIGQFFISGNRAAGKGTWRVQTIQRVRTGMKLLQMGLDKTAYPSATTDSNLVEVAPWDTEASDYNLNFRQSFSATSTTSAVFLAGTHEGTILDFTTVIPVQFAPGDASASKTAPCTRFTLSFPTNAEKAPQVAKDYVGAVQVQIPTQEMILTMENGTVTFTKSGGGGSFSAPVFSSGVTYRMAIPSVHQIAFEIMRVTPNQEHAPVNGAYPSLYPLITLKISLECKDPWDGRLSVTEHLIHMINTQIISS